jgi:hypothetical protein
MRPVKKYKDTVRGSPRSSVTVLHGYHIHGILVVIWLFFLLLLVGGGVDHVHAWYIYRTCTVCTTRWLIKWRRRGARSEEEIQAAP